MNLSEFAVFQPGVFTERCGWSQLSSIARSWTLVIGVHYPKLSIQYFFPLDVSSVLAGLFLSILCIISSSLRRKLLLFVSTVEHITCFHLLCWACVFLWIHKLRGACIVILLFLQALWNIFISFHSRFVKPTCVLLQNLRCILLSVFLDPCARHAEYDTSSASFSAELSVSSPRK